MNRLLYRIQIFRWIVNAVFILLLMYLFWIQVVKHHYYNEQALKQHCDSIPLYAERGKIFDCKNRLLAYNERGFSVRIFPQYVRSIDSVAEILTCYKLSPKDKLLAELKNQKHLFWVARFVDYEVGTNLQKDLMKYKFDNSVVVREAIKRIYPYGPVLGSIIGFTGIEGGLAGIEFSCDQYLKGKSGWEILQKDALGNKYRWPSYRICKSINGSDVVLTIDLDIQQIAYQLLKKYVDNLQAIKGSVIVLNCEDGAVLALADYPDFDPNSPYLFPQDYWKITAITDEFEPGSVYKLIICATALQSEQMDLLLSQKYNTSSGYITIGGKKIKDVHNNGILNFEDIFIKSSNIGVSLLTLQITPDEFYQMEKKFGFGTRLGIELPGEAKGFIDRPEKLTPLRFANNAFGQGIRTTLLQLASAYLAIANDGVLLKPYIVKSIVNNNKIIYYGKKEIIRRVLSEKQSKMIKTILSKVVQEGTGRQAAIPGYEVCGKTGTAQKLEPNGKYSNSKSIMSFIGFFPKDDPKFLIAIMLDEPQKLRFAGETVCPLFKELALKILYLNTHYPTNLLTNL
ncbi:MAG: penicillin-binding protein 2 [candidate division WOR-3 bacterium]|nr:penicillin-binding protein 2 [candidate division WOR-3 bacterium]MCX7757343.1 penicillin-binding protein 2 [candidate division WOR-3 bacterium]MDW7988135.1 penicillin-binding protein 2 [candidate division WOR-3 bacterium]